MSSIFTIEVDEAGVALVTMDAPGRSMNVIDQAFLAEFEQAVERLAGDPQITGAVITSGKPAFLAGADLMAVEALVRAARRGLKGDDGSARMNRLQRRLETCGKPVAAAFDRRLKSGKAGRAQLIPLAAP